MADEMKLPPSNDKGGPQYVRTPKYAAKKRKPENGGGDLDYPAMYNEEADSPDEVQFGDVESMDSGDPFQNVDSQDNQDAFEHQESPNPKSKMYKLRKKGMPE